MKYMVVECHPGYAVVLDESGNFLKVANKSYKIGQMLTEVVPMQAPKKRKAGKWMTGLTVMAACLALALWMFLPGTQQPYASVYVKINPEVRIDVDRQDVVVGLSGVNQDGMDLIADYDYHRKDLDLVTNELMDKAIDMGYLVADGQITISLESQDQTWMEHHSRSISNHLQSHLQEHFVVTIQVQMHHEKHYADGDREDHDVHWGGHEDDDEYEKEDHHDAGATGDEQEDDRDELQIERGEPDDERNDHNEDHDEKGHHDDDYKDHHGEDDVS